jgi:hypothetical protein
LKAATGVSGSGTCFTQQTMFIDDFSHEAEAPIMSAWLP